MSFGRSIRVCLSRWLTFSGRASRGEFWWFAGFAVIGAGVGVVALGAVRGALDGRAASLAVAAVVSGLIVLGVAAVSAAVRRLHDRNVGGWWVAVVIALGVLDLAINTGGTAGGFGLVVRLAAAAGALALIVQAALKGRRGANAYGSDPLARARDRTGERQPAWPGAEERVASGPAIGGAQSAARSWPRK
jgi:uncharacterized membrane protein YhaH (DUF805 family)